MITIIERSILESLQEQSKNLYQLHIDTKLSERILINTLRKLKNECLVKHTGMSYSLNTERMNKMTVSPSYRTNLKFEVKELINSIIEDTPLSSNQANLKLKKFHLNTQDMLLLNAKFKDIELFLDQIHRKNKKLPSGKTADKKIIFWGKANYSDIIQTTIRET